MLFRPHHKQRGIFSLFFLHIFSKVVLSRSRERPKLQPPCVSMSQNEELTKVLHRPQEVYHLSKRVSVLLNLASQHYHQLAQEEASDEAPSLYHLHCGLMDPLP